MRHFSALAACVLAGMSAAGSSRADEISPMIVRHAAANNIPHALADAIVRLESRYNARARNGANIGLTQISRQTARSLGYAGDAAGLFDADTNLRYGIRYLAMAYRLSGGDVCGAVMRYQSGLRATRMSHANRVYCGKVRALMGGRKTA